MTANDWESMEENKIYKTVKQYSEKLPPETMAILREIAEDYAKVKAFVYNRYGGIRGMLKVQSAYTVQNELAKTGFRESLGLPSVYFGLATFSALTDIKSMWSNLKRKIIFLARQNLNLTDQERHYIFTVLKYDASYFKILNRQDYELPESFKNINLDYKRLNNLICRLTRRHMARLAEPAKKDYFETYRRAYKYKAGGILLATKTPYHRVFVPVKDTCQYTGQMSVSVLEDRIVLSIPVKIRTHYHSDYSNCVAISFGYTVMAVSSSGNRYGDRLGEYLSEETERLTRKLAARNRLHGRYRVYCREGVTQKADLILKYNLGKKKYEAQKEKNNIRILSYINMELNRLIRDEKPSEMIIASSLKQFSEKFSRAAKRKLFKWPIGYIRRRLEFKCNVHCVKLILVNPSDTGRCCSACGGLGERSGQNFRCHACGALMDYHFNAAVNLLKKADGSFIGFPENG